jgi:hypothetical protein
MPNANYKNKVRITSPEKLEEESLLYTKNFTPEQRLEYLYKLRRILYGDDLSEPEKIFYESNIEITKMNEDS